MSDEFFVGYLEAPPEARRRLRRTALAMIALAFALAVVLAWATGPFDHASFEFATLTTFDGTIEAHPVPVVLVSNLRVWIDHRGWYDQEALIADAPIFSRLELADTTHMPIAGASQQVDFVIPEK